jgi:type IV secretory pathway TraG/TraD family ATPase VirD4
MPKLKAVIDGPAVGRGQKVSYLLIAQDLGQISAEYGAEHVETLMSTTAAKIILTQNNMKTAKIFEEIMGEEGTWYEKYKDNSVVSAFDVKTEYTEGKKKLYSASKIMSLGEKKQIIIMQDYPRYPIEADAPRYYLDPKLLAKSKVPAAPAIPDWVKRRNAAKK